MKKIVGIIITITSYLLTAQPSYPLTLNETIQTTVTTNPDILTNEKSQLAVTEALKQAKAAYLPQIKATMGYGFGMNRNSSTIGNPTGSFPLMPRREVGMTMSQMVFDGFSTRSNVARNVAQVDSATYKVLASINDLVQQDIESYLGVLREIELVKLAQDNLAFHEKVHRMITLRTESGVSRMADLYQADARLALAKSNLLAELSNLSDAKANFYRTIGLPAESLGEVEPPNRIFLPMNQDQAIATALKNNPVIKAASADISAAIQQHNIAKATNFPRLDLQLGATRDRNLGGIRGPNYDQYAMLRVSYSLFTGGADISKQQETAYQKQQAQEIKARAVRQLTEAVKLTWNLLTTARSDLVWLKAHQDSSQKTVAAYAKQYSIGQRTLLDLLDGQNELFSAQRAYVTGKSTVIVSEYRILRDMGLSVIALNIGDHLIGKNYAAAAHDVEILPANPATAQQSRIKPSDLTSKLPAHPQPVTPAPEQHANNDSQGWAIQLGSFKNQDNAKRLAEKLQAAGYRAFTKAADPPQSHITRVYIGPESMQASAKQLSHQLEKQLNMRGIIVEY